MELERVKKELELKNDINSLKVNEIVDKYAKNIESATELLRKVSTLYGEALYPLHMLDRHTKIENIVDEVTSKYDTEENRGYANYVKNRISKEFRSFNSYSDAYDFQGQAEYIFHYRLGANYFNNQFGLSYENTCKTLYDKLNEFEYIYNEDDMCVHPKSLVEQYNCMYKGKPYGGVVYSKDTLNKFYDNIPLMNLCFDKEYLLLASYLLDSKKVSEEDKERIIDITNNVIYISLNCNPIGEKEATFNKREYSKVAKKTRSNIKDYETKLINSVEKNKKLKKTK